MKLPPKLKSQNPYRLLGISDFSKPLEIKKGFRKLILRYHPDRFPDDILSYKKFELGVEAYRFLMNENNRKAFNGYLRNGSASAIVFKNTEYLKLKRKPGSSVYTPSRWADIEHSRFVEECRANFRHFLENLEQVKVKPRFYSKQNMSDIEYKGFVNKCRNNFQEFLRGVPKVTQD